MLVSVAPEVILRIITYKGRNKVSKQDIIRRKCIRGRPLTKLNNVLCYFFKAGVDQGFLVEGAPTLQGAPRYDFTTFSKNMHETEKVLSRTEVNMGAIPP